MDLPVEQPLANRRENVEMNLVSMLRTDPFSTPFRFHGRNFSVTQSDLGGDDFIFVSAPRMVFCTVGL